jgi:hypothetical protein
MKISAAKSAASPFKRGDKCTNSRPRIAAQWLPWLIRNLNPFDNPERVGSLRQKDSLHAVTTELPWLPDRPRSLVSFESHLEVRYG